MPSSNRFSFLRRDGAESSCHRCPQRRPHAASCWAVCRGATSRHAEIAVRFGMALAAAETKVAPKPVDEIKPAPKPARRNHRLRADRRKRGFGRLRAADLAASVAGLHGGVSQPRIAALGWLQPTSSTSRPSPRSRRSRPPRRRRCTGCGESGRCRPDWPLPPGAELRMPTVAVPRRRGVAIAPPALRRHPLRLGNAAPRRAAGPRSRSSQPAADPDSAKSEAKEKRHRAEGEAKIERRTQSAGEAGRG